jgi:hypothetical protein
MLDERPIQCPADRQVSSKIWNQNDVMFVVHQSWSLGRLHYLPWWLCGADCVFVQSVRLPCFVGVGAAGSSLHELQGCRFPCSMTGRGRGTLILPSRPIDHFNALVGRPPKSSPSPQPTDPTGGQQPGRFPVSAAAAALAGPFAGMPSFTTGTTSLSCIDPQPILLDILNQLPPPKQVEMIALVNRFKSKQISIQEFLGISKNLLGDRLYAVLVVIFYES